MKIYEIKQPEQVQKQACLLDTFQDLNFKLRILSLIKKLFSLGFIYISYQNSGTSRSKLGTPLENKLHQRMGHEKVTVIKIVLLI